MFELAPVMEYVLWVNVTGLVCVAGMLVCMVWSDLKNTNDKNRKY